MPKFLRALRDQSGKRAKSTWSLPACNNNAYNDVCKVCYLKELAAPTIATYKFDAYTDDDHSDYVRALKYRAIENCISNQHLNVHG